MLNKLKSEYFFSLQVNKQQQNSLFLNLNSFIKSASSLIPPLVLTGFAMKLKIKLWNRQVFQPYIFQIKLYGNVTRLKEIYIQLFGTIYLLCNSWNLLPGNIMVFRIFDRSIRFCRTFYCSCRKILNMFCNVN